MPESSRKKCSYRRFVVSGVPVLFVILFMSWAYYAYIFEFCLNIVPSTFELITYLIFFHLFYTMFFWSYISTIITCSDQIPSTFKVPPDIKDQLRNATTDEHQRRILKDFAKNLPILIKTDSGNVRFCDKCDLVKPDRAHHCSVCRTCVLKMDHHCPWVNNCVSFYNYKYFMLFLIYSLLLCIFVTATTFEYFIMYWKNELEKRNSQKIHILFLWLASVVFGISQTTFLMFHFYLVSRNRTTLEMFRPPRLECYRDRNDGFSIGRYKNFEQVFGTNKKLWLFPVFTSIGDGVVFPTGSENLHHINDPNRVAVSKNHTIL